ncbi:MAG: hypothetical protein Q7T56_18880 [Nocardioidaceae bacterium]|nr:hypothetical protein [Nocardioidaceae bacterium]
MSPQVTVVVTASSVHSFRDVLVSLDQQTLDASQFAVVGVHDALGSADREPMRQMARHRPNVSVVADDSALGSVVGDGLVATLADGERLVAEGLERLLAASTDADLVVGRPSTPSASLTVRQLFGAGALDRDVLSDLAAHLPSLARVSLLDADAPVGSVADLRARAVAGAISPVLLTGRPVGSAPTPPERVVVAASSQVRIDAGTARWDGGTLVLETVVAATGDASLRPDTLTAWVRHTKRGTELQVPVETSPSDDGLQVRVSVDLVQHAGRVDPGAWVVVVQVATSLGVARRRLGPTDLPAPAIVDGRLVTLALEKKRLLVDVGATRPSRLPVTDLSGVSVVESARGTELSLPLPLGSVSGDADVPAVLRLGGFPLRAHLVRRGDRYHLEGFLSGLAGREPMTLSVAGSAWLRLGCDLVIDGRGTMTVSPEEPQAVTPGPGSSRRPAPAAPTAQDTALRVLRGARRQAGRVARRAEREVRARLDR